MSERCGHCGSNMTDAGISWIGERVGSRPLSINKLRKLYPPAAEDRLRTFRHEWCDIGSRSKNICWINHGRPVELHVTPLHADSRTPQDAGNCYPEALAAIEGLRCAGILADVTWESFVSMAFYAPDIVGYDGLRIEIRNPPTRSDAPNDDSSNESNG